MSFRSNKLKLENSYRAEPCCARQLIILELRAALWSRDGRGRTSRQKILIAVDVVSRRLVNRRSHLMDGRVNIYHGRRGVVDEQ
jgi:hypothetical protein